MVDVSMPAALLAENEFRMGAAISRTFSVFRHHPGRFLLIAGIAAFPSLVGDWLQGSLVHDLNHQVALGPDGGMMQQPKNVGGVAYLALLLGSVLSIMAQSAIMNSAFADLSGRSTTVGASLRVGIARFWPVLGAGIIFGTGVVLGFALLVIPGFVLITMWLVATPACVIEKLGPVKSLNRSAALTRGHRWQILGLMVLLLVAIMIVGGLSDLILIMIGGAIFLIGQFAIQVVSIALFAILTVVIYHDLRVAQEGIDSQTVVGIFD